MNFVFVVHLQKYFCRAMLCISAALPSCGVCLSVRPSDTFVYSVKMIKYIFEIFPPLGSYTILVFHAKRYGNIPTRNPLTGASNAGGVGKNCDSRRIYDYRIRINECWSVINNCDGRPCTS